MEKNPLHRKPVYERSTYEDAFVQITNLWRMNAVAREFVFNQRLALIAADLMGVAGVWLNHAQALYKEPGGGVTPWHTDRYYWPVASENTCTVWMPLQETPVELGPLKFSVGSHQFAYGRNLAICDESEVALQWVPANQRFETENGPFDLGEVSYHLGWMFHYAGPNLTDPPRAVMMMIYLEDGIRLIEPKRDDPHAGWAAYMPGIQPGMYAGTPLNPLLYHHDWDHASTILDSV